MWISGSGPTHSGCAVIETQAAAHEVYGYWVKEPIG
jgi:hypothetical protein